MTPFQFWEHMLRYAQMSRLWWYSYAALPAFIVAVGAFVLMLFALRQKSGPPVVFFWLLIASLPAVLILPSFYVTVDLAAALGRVDFALPATPQQFSLVMARQIGSMLDILATFGIVGVSLATLVLAASPLLGHVPVASPLIRELSQTFTRAITRAIPGRRSPAAVDFGTLKVAQGLALGSEFAVRNASIGKQEADITLTDAIISRRHARIEVTDGVARLWDEQSTNGTYIRRGGATVALNGEPVELVPGDAIYLGRPDHPTAVCLIYERSE